MNLSFLILIEKPISFPTPLHDLKSEVGFFATFEAEHDHPRAEAYWAKDGEEIEKSDKFEMSQDGPTKYKLVVNDCTPEDIGKYSLVVGKSKTETAANLSVESKHTF